MYLRDAENLARKLMREWLDNSWTFVWTDARGRLGDCNHGRRRIRLSTVWVRLNAQDVIENTIRHEIAHALSDPKAGHGAEWKRNARLVGAAPVRCANQTDMELTKPTTKWEATCGGCGTTYGRHRLKPGVNGRRACTPCCDKHNKGKFDQRFVLNFRQKW